MRPEAQGSPGGAGAALGQPSTPSRTPSRAPAKEASILAWCLGTLLLLYVVGGAVFSWLERDAELEHYQKNRFLFEQMREMYEFDKCKEDWFNSTEFCKKQQEFSDLLRVFFERGGNGMEDKGKWTFVGSAFYVGTLVTTLGYGSLHPVTPGGQLFSVIFGIAGIPLMGYVLSHVGSYVVNVLMPMYPTIETRVRQVVVLGGLMICLILIGGVLYSLLENWPFLAACYFSACTLLTVGFGDYLPSHTASRLITLAFIMVGLGVAASFIALLQIHVEARGEHFAKRLASWYDAVASNCGAAPAAASRSPAIEESAA